ncbi:hypothetical protein ACTR76_001677 [Escherichia coli]
MQGETLGSHNAVIEEINRDHVMLRYQGKIERLSLAEEERSTVAVTNKKAVSDEAKQAVAEPAASAPVEIPTAVRQALAKDPQKIFNYIQLTAFFNNRAGSGTKGNPAQHHIKTRFCHRHRFGLFYRRGDGLIFAKPVLLAD